jgi:hypothetical protein
MSAGKDKLLVGGELNHLGPNHDARKRENPTHGVRAVRILTEPVHIVINHTEELKKEEQEEDMDQQNNKKKKKKEERD